MIIPFNFDNAQNLNLNTKFPAAASFYSHLWNDGGVPAGNIIGNGEIGVKYSANGEASDYLLA